MNTHIDPDKTISKIQKSILANPIKVDLTERIMNNLESNNRKSKYMTTHFKETWKFKTLITLGSSFAAIFILVGASMASPAVAATLNKIPVVNSLFHFAGDMGLQIADQDGLYNTLDVSDTYGEFAVKASAVSYDGSRVSVAIEGEGANKSFVNEVQDVNIQINGRDIKSYSSAKDNNVGIFFFPTVSKDALILEFGDLRNQGGMSFPDNFNATIDLSIQGVQKSFKLEVPVKLNTKDNVVLEPNTVKINDGVEFKVSKIEMTPITTNITTEVTIPKNLTDLKKKFGYELTDSEGMKIGVIYAHGWNDDTGNVLITDTKFEPFTTLPKTIILKPFTYAYQDNSSKFQTDADGNLNVNYLPQLETIINIK